MKSHLISHLHNWAPICFWTLRSFYHCFADDAQTYFTFQVITDPENKLGLVFSKVHQWMRFRRVNLNSDKTDCSLVTAKIAMHRNFDVNSVMFGNIPVQLSNSARKLGFALDNTGQQWNMFFIFEPWFLSEFFSWPQTWHWFCDTWDSF